MKEKRKALSFTVSQAVRIGSLCGALLYDEPLPCRDRGRRPPPGSALRRLTWAGRRARPRDPPALRPRRWSSRTVGYNVLRGAFVRSSLLCVTWIPALSLSESFRKESCMSFSFKSASANQVSRLTAKFHQSMKWDQNKDNVPKQPTPCMKQK